MTDVLLLADIPSTGYLVGTSAERVSGSSRASEETAHLVKTFEQRLRDNEAVLALYPKWNAEGPRRLLKLARGVINTDRIAGVELALPPLALSLVADQVAYLAPYLQPGHLASVARRLASVVLAGAWTRSVTKLEYIDTKMGDHLASYLPHETFVVTAAPKPAIHRISGHKLPQLPYRPTEPIHLLITESEITWFQEGMRHLMRPDAVKVVRPQPLGLKFWGNKRYIEFVAFSGHPSALSQIANETRCWPCGWCGQHIALEECPFCGMGQPEGGAPPSAMPRPRAATAGRTASPQAPAQQPDRSPRALPAAAQAGPPAAHGPAQQARPAPQQPAQPRDPVGGPPPAAPTPTPQFTAPVPPRPAAPGQPTPHGNVPHGAPSPGTHPDWSRSGQGAGASTPAPNAPHGAAPPWQPTPAPQAQFSYPELPSGPDLPTRTRPPRARPAGATGSPAPQPPYPPSPAGQPVTRGPQTPQQAAEMLRSAPQWNGRNAGGNPLNQHNPGTSGQTTSQYPSAVDTVRGTTSARGPEQASIHEARNDQNWTGRNQGNPSPRPNQPNGQPPDRVSP